jgi:RNA polymerase sigma-70 factor (ECF subfamily)
MLGGVKSITPPPPTTSKGTAAAAPVRGDVDSQAWIAGLDPHSDDRDAAIDALHALLLQAARFEVRRLTAARFGLCADERDAMARHSADDALAVVLGNLDQFHGTSRFTTWACKFALAESARQVHRSAWHGREIPAAGGDSTLLAGQGQGQRTRQLFSALEQAIQTDLSPDERELLVAAMLNDVPLDVLAERHLTTRGALYRTIQDARKKLRTALSLRGFSVAEHTEANSQ